VAASNRLAFADFILRAYLANTDHSIISGIWKNDSLDPGPSFLTMLQELRDQVASLVEERTVAVPRLEQTMFVFQKITESAPNKIYREHSSQSNKRRTQTESFPRLAKRIRVSQTPPAESDEEYVQDTSEESDGCEYEWMGKGVGTRKK
jgi:hypothetical protein